MKTSTVVAAMIIAAGIGTVAAVEYRNYRNIANLALYTHCVSDWHKTSVYGWERTRPEPCGPGYSLTTGADFRALVSERGSVRLVSEN